MQGRSWFNFDISHDWGSNKDGCPEGCIVGKIQFTWNRKIDNGWKKQKSTAGKKMKSRMLNAAFRRYLKQCFGRCLENVEIKDAKRCLL